MRASIPVGASTVSVLNAVTVATVVRDVPTAPAEATYVNSVDSVRVATGRSPLETV